MKRNEETDKAPITAVVNGEEDYRVLWLSVIMQNLSDALSGSDKYPFNKRRKEALEWFDSEDEDGSDFAMVCELAGVDFSATKKRIQMFLDREIDAVDFRCLHKGVSGDNPPENRGDYLRRIRRREEQKKRRKPLAISPAFFRRMPKTIPQVEARAA